MASIFNYDFTEVSKLDNQLEKLVSRRSLMSAKVKAIRAGALVFLKSVKAKSPVLTGELRSSHYAERVQGEAAYVVGSDNAKAAWLNFGTKMRENAAGKNLGRIQPTHYFTKALSANIDKIEHVIYTNLDTFIKEKLT